ncbi:helix-turn-helix domain-containing protein [Micromonospora sp. CA-263727]|uniref:helix-turn-helix domain-containing protein n=1 Tax=Micromonospora sp. CA-263727 TaxID=3239967 RepID=UPI003D8E3253
MPRGRSDRAPNAYIAHGQWPEATLRPDAPASAHYSQALAHRLETAMRARPVSIRGLAKLAGLTHPTIISALRGDKYPDLRTLACLEVALGVELYPAGLYQHLHPQ